MAEEKKDNAVRNFAIIGGIITAAIVGIIVIPEVMRDKWEITNRSSIISQLKQADSLRQTDPAAAYKLYESVLKESSEHKVTDESLKEKLESAEKAKQILYPKVENILKAEKAEKQRLLAEQKRHEAEELRRLNEEKKRQVAAEEAKRILEEKRQNEIKRRKQALSLYQNAPQSARNSLNVLKKLEARIEIGINYRDYSTVVGESWGEIRVFNDSPEGKNLQDFSILLTKAVGDYKTALKIWRNKIEFPSLAKAHEKELDALQQLCWLRASSWIQTAEALLDSEQVEKTLEKISENNNVPEDLDAKADRILLEK